MTISYIKEIDNSPYIANGSVSVLLVVGDYLYVGGTGYDVAWDEIPVWNIWDISNVEDPTHVRTITWGPSITIFDFSVKDDRIYIAAPDYDGNAGIYVYDISDPSNPTYVDMIAGAGSPNYLDYVNVVCVDGDRLYASADWESPDYISVFDISDPNSISLLKAIYVEDRAPRAGAYIDYMVVRDNIVYAELSGYKISGPRLITIDLSDLNSPIYTWMSDYTPAGDNNGIHDIILDGDIMLVPHWWSGSYWYTYFKTWDISDPSNVTLLDTFPADWQGHDAPGVYFTGYSFAILIDNYLISTDDERFSVYDISDPANVAFVESSYDTDFRENQWGYTRKDNVGYYVDNVNDKLILINLSDYIDTGIAVGDTVLCIPNYGDTYNRAAIKGDSISVGDDVRLYPLKDGAKVSIKEKWSSGDNIIF